MIHAIVNGESRSLAPGTTVAALVAALDLAGRRIAVEVNRGLVPLERQASLQIGDGDQIEIVHFVGGG